MKAIAIGIMMLLFPLGCGAAGPAGEWVPLFDGASLKGWHVAARPEDRARNFWTVRDSAITCDSRGRKDHDYVWLLTDGEYADFELKLKVRGYRESTGNSGVQVRSRYDEAAFWLDGPQVDIHPPAPWRTGLIYDETRGTRRWIFPSLPDWKIEPQQGPRRWKWKYADEGDGWNAIDIVCRGTTIRTAVNGILIADLNGAGILDDDAHRMHNVGLRGRIGLQLHSRDELLVQFKDISIRTLPPAGPADWQTRSDIPYHVYGHAAATLGGRIHLLGGCHTDNWQVPSASHQIYDPALDKWSAAADLPLATGWAMPAVHGGKIYLFGGGYFQPGKGMTSSDGAWVYDPATGKWSAIGRLPQPRMNGLAAAAGDYIYVSLGYNRQGGGDKDVAEEYRSTYRYDPASDTYTRVADAPVTGCYVASGAYRGKVYAAPGSHREYGFHGDYVWADGALEYDPAADRWTRIDAPRASKRVFFLTQSSASVVDAGKLWVIGGMAENRTRTVMTEYFDIERRVFVRGPDIDYGRCCGGGGIVDGLLVIAGGFVDGAGLGTPALPTWTLKVR